jgi:hypothetical protein
LRRLAGLLAGAEQSVDRRLAPDFAHSLTFSLAKSLAIGDSICLLDQDPQTLRSFHVGLVEVSLALTEFDSHFADDGQGFAMQPRHGIVEPRPDLRWRPAPPLTVSEEEIDRGIAILDQAISDVMAGPIADVAE